MVDRFFAIGKMLNMYLTNHLIKVYVLTK